MKHNRGRIYQYGSNKKDDDKEQAKKFAKNIEEIETLSETSSATPLNEEEEQQFKTDCNKMLEDMNIKKSNPPETLEEFRAKHPNFPEQIARAFFKDNDEFKKILDQMYQDKLDAKNEQILQLQTQVNMLNLAASQTAQTAALVADNTAQSPAHRHRRHQHSRHHWVYR